MMHATLSTVLAPLDRASVERERDELREQLEDCEALLRLIDRHQGNARASSPPTSVPETSQQSVAPTNGHRNGNGNSHAPLTRKRDTVLAILRENPGRWANSEMRTALAERGIDPKAGTPVKNIMWKLAKDGIVHASGNGVYEYPALNDRTPTDDDQEAMGV